MIILFIGMVFTQLSPVSDGKTFTFWAGGHTVYFECVLLANIVLLRATNNWTGWGELLIFMQVTSYFWILYLDSVMFTNAISYFFDEFFSSWTAWLGCFFVLSTMFIEKACLDAWSILKNKFISSKLDHSVVHHSDDSALSPNNENHQARLKEF